MYYVYLWVPYSQELNYSTVAQKNMLLFQMLNIWLFNTDNVKIKLYGS